MSSSTRTCPSHSADAPMPIVGIGDLLGDARGEQLGNSLDHHGERACFGHCAGIVLEPGPFGAAAPAGREPAKLIDCLWRHADMAHHRECRAPSDSDGLGHLHATFELDGAATRFLHDAGGAAEGDRGALLIGAERHDRPRRAPAPSRAPRPEHARSSDRAARAPWSRRPWITMPSESPTRSMSTWGSTSAAV